jgi:hypothetical protein
MESHLLFSKELFILLNSPEKEKEKEKDIDPEETTNNLYNKEKVKYKKKTFNQIFKTKDKKKIKY